MATTRGWTCTACCEHGETFGRQKDLVDAMCSGMLPECPHVEVFVVPVSEALPRRAIAQDREVGPIRSYEIPAPKATTLTP